MIGVCQSGLSRSGPPSVGREMQTRSPINLLTFPRAGWTMGRPKMPLSPSLSPSTWRRSVGGVGKSGESSALIPCPPRPDRKWRKRQHGRVGESAMSWNERVELYGKIETYRKRPLIAYITSKREGVNGLMATDVLPYIIKQIDDLPPHTKPVDFLIVSYGGDPMVAWRIMSLIRQRGIDNVAVIIPQRAFSAATLVAFGADEIVMHPNGHLGPVDLQITTWGEGGQPKRFSTEDISAFLEFVSENLKITDQQHTRALFELTCKEVGTLGIGFTARSSNLSVDLG